MELVLSVTKFQQLSLLTVYVCQFVHAIARVYLTSMTVDAIECGNNSCTPCLRKIAISCINVDFTTVLETIECVKIWPIATAVDSRYAHVLAGINGYRKIPHISPRL